MFVYLLTLLLANTCSHSFGNPITIPKGNEPSGPLSTVLADLADSCNSPPLSSLIKTKVEECNVLPPFTGKKQIECLLLLDISTQLCNAVAANQVTILPANTEKIREYADVGQLCTAAKSWNTSILSQDPKYNDTVDKIFKNELKCAQVCGVEENISSQDSNFFCKFYKWGMEILSAGNHSGLEPSNNIQSIVSAQDQLKLASDLPSEEGGADPASSVSNSRGNEGHLQHEVPQPPEPQRNLEPVKPDGVEEELAEALGNHEAPNPAGNPPPQNLAGASGHPAIQNLDEASGHPAIHNLPGALGHPAIQNLPGASGNPEKQNLPGALGHPTIQNLPGASGHPEKQNLPGALGHSTIQNLSGASGHPAIQNLPGASGNPAIHNLPGSSGIPVIQNAAGASGNEVSKPAVLEGISGIPSMDTSQNIPQNSNKNNNDGAVDYEDQENIDDQVEKDTSQFQNYNEAEGVNVDQTQTRLSVNSGFHRGETDILSSNKLPGYSDVDDDEDHFFSFFLTVIIMVVLLYILYHNKNKVSKVFFGLLVEGRQGRRRNSRGHAYRRLDTLEQAMSTNSAAPPSKIIY